MKLDRHTYEAWLLDRTEGNLTPEQERQLDEFLAANRELQAGADVLPKVDAGNTPYSAKEMLHRSFPPRGEAGAARLNDFLAARLEGDLSPEQEKQLDRYLYEHPEAAADAKSMAKAKVVPVPILFEGKPKLERHFPPHGLPGAHNLTDFLIAEAEGDLTAEQRTALERYLLHRPDAQREQRLVAAARMPPAPLAFPWKKQLRKREVRVLTLWTRWAAAASVALLLGMGWWFSQRDQSGDAGIALKLQPNVSVEPASSLRGTVQEAAPTTPDRVVAELPVAVKNTSWSVPEQHQQQAQAAPVKTQSTAKQLEERAEPGPPAQTVHQPMPPAEPGPALAQQRETPGQEEMPAEQSIAAATEPMALATASEGQSLGLFVVNKVRGEVLDAPQRPTGVDGKDVLAMADRAIGAVSGGQSGVQVHRTANGERIRLRLGRNFSISASRGH